MSDDKVRKFVEDECRKSMPATAMAMCLLAARAARMALGLDNGARAMTDRECFTAAIGLAQGLFGEAWGKASYAKRCAWLEMCEEAVREVSK